MKFVLATIPFALMPTLDSSTGQDHGGANPRQDLPSAAEIAELPPDGGAEFNRLVFESSPYLRQHARNPVDWYPWGPEAFARAAAEDKPIFLSIGYSTCHWCHVMEHESFEDDEVAALLNQAFISIKVDREERPDLDQVYMSVTQAMTGRGGWPMTVVMTPERLPFFAGTYFPKSGVDGRPGMMQLVPGLASAWENDRDNVLDTSKRVLDYLNQASAATAGETLDVGLLGLAQTDLKARYDKTYAGFGPAPKFPTPHNLRLLLRSARRSGDRQALDMVVETLRAMRRGGIWDHVGFGFHRYSTDQRWLLPHFEKMLYDQALIALACVEAWQVTGHADLRRTAEEIFTYVLRDMTDTQGGFYSAEDADSEGEEGLFYLWRPEELVAVLGAEDGALAGELWNVSEGGNFREQSTGVTTGESILHLSEAIEVFARRKDLDPAEFAGRVEDWRGRLFSEREARVRPLRDDKVLTDWNGLMIAALAAGGRAFGEARYVEAATRSADFVLENLRGEDGRLLKRWRNGQAGLAGVLDDYAYLTWGLIEVYEASGDARRLSQALEVNAAMLAHFHDPQGGGFFLAADDVLDVIVRAKETYDGAQPAGNSVAAANLLRLAQLTGSSELESLGRETLLAFAGEVAAQRLGHAEYLCSLDFAVGPTLELVICGPVDSAEWRNAQRELGRRFLPRAVVLFRPDPDVDGQAALLDELAPFTAEQRALQGRLTYYLCQDFTCEAPTSDLAAVLARVDAGSQAPAEQR